MHINIGGGSDDALEEITKQVGDLEGMANITFAWMVDRVRQYSKLKFNDKTLDVIAARYMDNMGQVLERQISANAAQAGAASKEKGGWTSWISKLNPFDDDGNEVKTAEPPITFRGWGVGPISNSYTSQAFYMRGGGSRTRAPGRYLFKKTKEEKAPAVQKITFEYIHPVVAHAWSDKDPAGVLYQAKNDKAFLAAALLGFERVPQDNGKKGYKYVQKEKEPQSKGWIDPKLTAGVTDAEWTSDNFPECKSN